MSLPALAFAIYRSNYMPDKSIPQITGDMYDFLKQGYLGGHVDLYVPQAPKGSQIYCYDVNSLYPTVMRDSDMPVGMPQYFEYSEFIDLDTFNKYHKDAFGFFEVEIDWAVDIKRPIIQSRVKTDAGFRTVAGVGT